MNEMKIIDITDEQYEEMKYFDCDDELIKEEKTIKENGEHYE